eukprot:scpid84892/ scgid13628/ 
MEHSPTGYISQLYAGSISDRQLVIDCGILELLESVPRGQLVMADREFEIQDLLVKAGLILHIPTFKGSQASMPLKDGVNTQKIASVRIYVWKEPTGVSNLVSTSSVRIFHLLHMDQ